MIVLALLALVPLFLTGPAAAAMYVALLKRGYRRALWAFWALLACATILLGYTIAHTFGDLFPGLGCFATLWTPAAVLLTVLVFRRQTRRLDETVDPNAPFPRAPYAALLALIVLQLSAPLIAFGYAQSCALLNRRAAQPIVAALESYRQEHGRYPFPENRHRSDLSMLVPEHLESIPPLACQNPFARPDEDSTADDWHLYFCQNSPGQETLLLIPLIGTDSLQIYNPDTKWWTRGNAFDGFCP
jgi:hypothetical protein